MNEIDDGAVRGRVVENGVAQSVFREDGVTHIRLTHMPGQPLPQSGTIPLPEPVSVEGGGIFVLEMEWLSEAQREQASQPMRVPSGTIINKVITGS